MNGKGVPMKRKFKPLTFGRGAYGLIENKRTIVRGVKK